MPAIDDDSLLRQQDIGSSSGSSRESELRSSSTLNLSAKNDRENELQQRCIALEREVSVLREKLESTPKEAASNALPLLLAMGKAAENSGNSSDGSNSLDNSVHQDYERVKRQLETSEDKVRELEAMLESLKDAEKSHSTLLRRISELQEELAKRESALSKAMADQHKSVMNAAAFEEDIKERRNREKLLENKVNRCMDDPLLISSSCLLCRRPTRCCKSRFKNTQMLFDLWPSYVSTGTIYPALYRGMHLNP